MLARVDIDCEMLARLAACVETEKQIAFVIGIDPKTFSRKKAKDPAIRAAIGRGRAAPVDQHHIPADTRPEGSSL